MKFRVIYICFIFIFSFGTSKSQDVNWHCGLEPDSMGFVLYGTEIPESIEESYRKNSGKRLSARNTEVVLPVLFHHVKKTGDASIDPNIIIELVKGLNAIYANGIPYDKPDGVHTGIQFCLASRRPDGLPTNGLEIHDSKYHVIRNMDDYNAMTREFGWNPSDYINIYLCDTIIRNRQYVGGFATLPGSQHGKFFEGIVMKKPKVPANIFDAYLLAHEMGHYLGLRHTFEQGCKNDNCLLDGDKVCDTPPVKSPAFYPCTFTVNTCDTDEDDTDIRNPFRPVNQGGAGDVSDHNNLMDYAGCRDRLTQGQADRMKFFIDNVRNALLQSKACTQPCLDGPVMQIQIKQEIFAAGDTLNIANLSTGLGVYNWYLDGVLIHSGFSPPIISQIEVGKHIISLEIIPDDTLCDKVRTSQNFEVNCPLNPQFNYYVNGNVVYFNKLSTSSDSFIFKVYLGNQLIASSENTVDSFVLSVGGYIMCLEEFEDFCFIRFCSSLHIVVAGVEQCQNDIDDDGDGFVDAFDPDCPCDSLKFEANCQTDCQYVPEEFLPVKMKLKWQSDFVSDLLSAKNKNESIAPLIVVDPLHETIYVPSKNWVDISEDSTDYAIIKLDLKTGTTIARKIVYHHNYMNTGPIVIGDVDRDGSTDIFIYYVERENGVWLQNLARLDENGDVIWKNQNIDEPHQYLKLADFNGDGISELYSGNKIYNAETGTLLCEGAFGKGCRYFHSGSPCQYQNSIAQDITVAPGLELIAGNTIYEVVVNNLDGMSGNTMNPILAPAQVPDGLTAVADMDGDGFLDVIVLKTARFQGEERSLSIWNPQNGGTLLAKTYFNNDGGGVPTITDLDNDCIPEIIICLRDELSVYKYLADTIILWRIFKLKDVSGALNATAFDLNQNGYKEIIIRDEEYLKIIDPLNNLVLDSFAIKSTTFIESPIITDVDNDGHAEILIDGFLPEEEDRYRIFCFESANIPWAPSRVVWNQHGYHVTNVQDDLTIPRHSQDVAKKFNTTSCARNTCPEVYNSYMVQATHRTQNGCEQFPAVDITLQVGGYTCDEDEIEVVLTLEDISKNKISQDSVFFSSYIRIPDFTNAAFQSDVFHLSPRFKSGEKDTFRLILKNLPAGTRTILFRINDPGMGGAFSSLKGLTETLECNYENNIALLDINLDSLTLDLGPDIIKCKNDVVTLEANQKFDSYEWSDFSNAASLTVSDPGLYTLRARDICNRLYTDSINIKVDSSSLLLEIPDIEKCYHEDVSIQTQNGLDWVKWLPSDIVSCDTCSLVTISGNEDVVLYLLASNNGCIDVDTIQIKVKVPVFYVDPQTICRGDSLYFFGQSISDPGEYIYQSIQCDSTVQLILETINPDSNYVNFEICRGDSINVNNNWYTDEIEEIILLQNQLGCDSTLFLSIKVIDTIYNHFSTQICFGDSIQIGNVYYKESGLYEYISMSSAGCPVLEKVDLKVIQHPIGMRSENICTNDSLYFNGNWLFASGVYVDTIHDPSGCDSIIVLNLQVTEELSKYDTIQSCTGQPVWVVDRFIEETGDYLNVVEGEPCDLIVYTRVEFHESSLSTGSGIVCHGDSVYVSGQWIKEAGVYEDYLVNQYGCDSTHILTLKEVPPHGDIIEEANCLNGLNYIEIPEDTGWVHTPEGNFFEFTEDTTFNIFWAHPEGCFDTTSIYLSKISSEADLPYLPDTLLYSQNAGIIIIPLSPEVWSLRWTPSSNLFCDTCFYLSLIRNEDTDLILNLIHKSGCTYQRQISIKKYEDSIIIPNIFTPGIEGVNKIWKMSWSKSLTFKKLAIYDRWGNQVHHINANEPLEWDGTFNQKPLEQGVYIIFIEYLDEFENIKMLTKDVTLIW